MGFGVWKKWLLVQIPFLFSIEAMSNYGTSRFWQELCGHHHKIEPVRVDEQCTRFVFFEIQAKCYLLNVNQPFEWQTCLANIKYSYCFVLKACLDWPLDATIAMLWFWTGQPWPTVRNIGWIWMLIGLWEWENGLGGTFLDVFARMTQVFVIGGNFICWLWFLFWRHWCFIGILARMK